MDIFLIEIYIVKVLNILNHYIRFIVRSDKADDSTLISGYHGGEGVGAGLQG
jgi:hypothetical protein